MSNFFPVSLKRLLSPSLALLTAIVLTPCVAHATPYVVKLTQQGSNVVATGSGALDLTGLTLFGSGVGLENLMQPSASLALQTGSHTALVEGFFANSVSGPASFGSGGATVGSSGNGDPFGFNAYSGSTYTIFVPANYASGSTLSNTTFWDNTNFASLGVTLGTHTWTWGTGADQSFTLVTAVPEPATLGMFGLGVLLIGGFFTLRRREQRHT